jgi:MOSC domain-containing protein YiiM
MSSAPSAVVVAVHASRTHTFSKAPCLGIALVAGLGVQGDAHCGATVKHRSRVARDPTKPNFRQVHLIAEELLTELTGSGFEVAAGRIGENVTTRGVDLLKLPAGTLLSLGDGAVVELTGLRNPCVQLDRYQSGLMAALLDRDAQGNLVRKAGVMGIVTVGGTVYPGDAIRVTLPGLPHRPLAPV